MTDQEIFDKVCTHLIKQARQSKLISYKSMCAYRGEGGASCAIGCLIPDALYYREMEGVPFRRLVLSNRQLTPYLPKSALLGVGLQDIHDADASWDEGGLTEYGVEKLRALAEELGLETTVLDILR